ncbi:MAG: serine hydrolase [Bacteroidota bacterium]
MNILRHFLIALGICAIFFVGLMIRHWDTTAMIFSNMTALSEGSTEARSLQLPGDVLDYLDRHRDTVSLVAVDLAEGRAVPALSLGGDTPRPVAGLTKVWVLAAYAQQVEAGRLDPEERVPLSALTPYHLPGTNDGSHARVTDRHAEAATLSLAQVVEAMMDDHYQAATDYLIRRLGGPALAHLPGELGWTQTTGPLPNSGLFLSWLPTAQPGDAPATPSADPDAVFALVRALEEDPDFQQAAVDRLAAEGSGLTIREQRDLAQATYPGGTATAYAQFMAQTLLDAERPAARRVRQHLDRPVPLDSTGTVGAFGVQGGGFPGLISFVGYVEGAEPGTGRVVALLMEEVPLAVFYHLVQTGLDKGLMLQLLLDDAFFAETQARFGGA